MSLYINVISNIYTLLVIYVAAFHVGLNVVCFKL